MAFPGKCIFLWEPDTWAAHEDKMNALGRHPHGSAMTPVGEEAGELDGPGEPVFFPGVPIT